MAKHLVLVAGNIGAGKTSLTERIGARLGWWTGYESVADNPYLSDFYTDMRAWSFHLQIFFLGHRADQYLEASRDARSSILDRSIYEDAHIFARALHHMGNLAERDYLAYRHLYELVVAGLPRPDLLIYLKAPVPTLMNRIRRRARNMETGISADYLALLNSFYDEWLNGFDLCPTLTIQTNDLDFVNQPAHLDTVTQRIQEKLTGKETMDLTEK
ncbi:MAG: deoxynucleoside kinase [Anaerolineales bacterium]|nr:deoxynucleoside kinase [Anaerolineales bacterium]MCZ2121829.1 deoxynucleoside kinase [Anaerolineales bacterium]